MDVGDEYKNINPMRMRIEIEIINEDEDGKSKILSKSDPLLYLVKDGRV